MHFPLEDVSNAQHGVFTTQQAAQAGLVRSDRDYLLRRGGWQPQRRGIYVEVPPPPGGPEGPHRAAVAARLALHGQGVCSHETAARLHGLALHRGREDEVILTMPSGHRSHRNFDGIHLHRATLPGGHVSSVEGIPVTSVARTLVDLGRIRPFGPALIPLDHALHQHLVSRDQLAGVVLDCRRWPGIRRASDVVEFGDAAAESPLESLGRLCLHQYGVPPPTLQHSIVLPDGQRSRADFWWQHAAVVGEADGLGKYTDAAVLRAEKLRQEALESMGLIVVRFTWADIALRPAETARRFLVALSRRPPR